MGFDTYSHTTASGVPDKDFDIAPPKLPEGFVLKVEPQTNCVRLEVWEGETFRVSDVIYYVDTHDLEESVNTQIRKFEVQFAKLAEAQALAKFLSPPPPTTEPARRWFGWLRFLQVGLMVLGAGLSVLGLIFNVPPVAITGAVAVVFGGCLE